MSLAARSGVVGVGYEGRTLEELVAQLAAMDVARVVDVRLNPISRKSGGRAVTEAGIAYEHRRELGNPKTNRSGFAGGNAEWEQAGAEHPYVALP